MDHYQKLLNCFLFSAPRTPINPIPVPPGVEFIEIITGGTVLFPDKESREYRKGTIFWHQPGEWTINHTPAADPYRCFVCHLATDGTPRQVPRITRWEALPDLNTFVDDMLNFAHRKELDRQEVFCYCLGTLLRQTLKKPPLPPQLQSVCRILNNDPAADIPVDVLAKSAGISTSRLFALFQKHLHTSPHKYQLKCRINMAGELLHNRMDLPIKQIAEMCGFSSLELFYRRFQQHTGITPGQFRKR